MKKLSLLALLGIGLFLFAQGFFVGNPELPTPTSNEAGGAPEAQASDHDPLVSPDQALNRETESAPVLAPTAPKELPRIPHFDNAPKRIQIQVVDYAGIPVANFPINHWQGAGDAPDKGQWIDGMRRPVSGIGVS